MENNLDLSKLSVSELKAEMKRREAAQVDDRKAYKDLVDETVPKAVLKLMFASQELSKAKTDIFKYFENTLQLKEKVYGKEKQQSHTFSTKTHTVTIGFRVNDGWDDTVTVGIEKVKRFISSLAKDENTAALVEMVFDLLKKDAKGNLKGNRVLELKKLTTKFNNDDFTDGVNIILEAYKPVRSSWFVDASLTDPNGAKVSIPLSMSAVDFVSGYEFDFFNEKPETDEHQD